MLARRGRVGHHGTRTRIIKNKMAQNAFFAKFALPTFNLRPATLQFHDFAFRKSRASCRPQSSVDVIQSFWASGLGVLCLRADASLEERSATSD
jgi:hypothetical protein